MMILMADRYGACRVRDTEQLLAGPHAVTSIGAGPHAANSRQIGCVAVDSYIPVWSAISIIRSNDSRRCVGRRSPLDPLSLVMV